MSDRDSDDFMRAKQLLEDAFHQFDKDINKLDRKAYGK